MIPVLSRKLPIRGQTYIFFFKNIHSGIRHVLVKAPYTIRLRYKNHVIWRLKFFDMEINSATLRLFRKVAVIEGISAVILFFIAMPLKYWGDMPQAVKYIGWLHGILFIGYCYLLAACWITYKWKFSRVVVFFLASFIPFAPFFVERKLR